jgi:GNAT superfamily N-acetyltransferase
MVKFISGRATLPLRSAVLRNHLPEAQCVFPTDEVPGAFHLGYFLEDELVCVASFLPNDHPGQLISTSNLEGGEGYQLRGMATDKRHTGKGFGAALVNFAKDHLKNLQASYLWCNARQVAVGFYSKLGFAIVSEEFNIPGIGPHYEMLVRLNK